MLRYLWIDAFAVVLAALRIAGHKSESFQAFAHLFVGGLFTEAWWEYHVPPPLGGRQAAWHKLGLAVALSLIELGCFLWFRFVA